MTRFATFEIDGSAHWGVASDGKIFDVSTELGKRYPTLKDVIAANAFKEAEKVAPSSPAHDESTIKWLPVVPNPGKIFCIGLNYENHRLETGREAKGHPTIFTRFADSQIGHKANIVRPQSSTALDYEGELAVVIGKSGRHIARKDALSYVAGYACYNDGSVRDWQNHTSQFTPGKNFPQTGAFGPYLVTSDEVGDLRELSLETRLNGQSVQSAKLDQLIFPVDILIEYCSAFTALNPGDVIITGTPGGVGFKRQPPLFMKPGDTVEVEITKVGLLRNGIADEAR